MIEQGGNGTLCSSRTVDGELVLHVVPLIGSGAEVGCELLSVPLIGLTAYAMLGVTIIIHHLSHGRGYASGGVVAGATVVVRLGLVPGNVLQQRLHSRGVGVCCGVVLHRGVAAQVFSLTGIFAQERPHVVGYVVIVEGARVGVAQHSGYSVVAGDDDIAGRLILLNT